MGTDKLFKHKSIAVILSSSLNVCFGTPKNRLIKSTLLSTHIIFVCLFGLVINFTS